MLNLVSVNNLSSMAYDLALVGSSASLRHHSPSQIAQMVQSGDVDAALLPVACLDSVIQQYETLGNYGIACRGDVSSVLLFCSIPLESIAEKQLAIYITPHSKTSRSLFEYLYFRRFGTMPELTDNQFSAYAHIFIGNESLEVAHSHNHSTEIIDLSGWWYRETNYPFVFALWVVRRETDTNTKETLLSWLNESTAIAHSPAGQELMALNNQSRFASPDEARSYYKNLNFRLGDDELVGLSLFQSSLRKMKSCSPAA